MSADDVILFRSMVWEAAERAVSGTPYNMGRLCALLVLAKRMGGVMLPGEKWKP